MKSNCCVLLLKAGEQPDNTWGEGRGGSGSWGGLEDIHL